MIKLILTIIEDLLRPERTWGEFSRRVISILVIGLTAWLGVDIYFNMKEYHDRFIPVAEMMAQKKSIAEEVKRLMQSLHDRNPEIKGIWLYSWPDAINLDLVHRVGQGDDPIPSGAFQREDAADVGRLGMDICTELNRQFKNTACTIFGEGDAWGVLVVVWEDGKKRPDGHINLVDALANRITHLLYYKH